MRARHLRASSFALLSFASLFAACGGGTDEGQTSSAVASTAGTGGSAGSATGQSGAAGEGTSGGGQSSTGGAGGEAGATTGGSGGSVAGGGGEAGASAGQGGTSGSAGAGGSTHSGIGDPCTGMFGSMGPTQGSCTDGQKCLPDNIGFDGGYCIADCSSTMCPTDSTCVVIGGQYHICMLTCGSNADCRTGYVCTAQHVCSSPNAGGGNEAGVTPGTDNGMACVQPVVDPPTPGDVFAMDQQLTSGAMEAEVELAADANGHVLVSWIQIQVNGSAKIGYSMSLDGGQTFQKAVLLPTDTTVDMNSDQSDPVVAVDAMGNFYVSWVGFDRSQSNPNQVTKMHVWVARIDGTGKLLGITDVAPGEWTAANFLDKPWVSASPVDGSVWVTWDRASQSGADIRMARSTDGGVTFGTPITISDTSDRPAVDRNLAQITVGADGKGYATWVELPGNGQFGSTANQVYFQRLATDGTKDGKNVLVTHSPDSPAFEDPSIAVAGNAVYVGFNSGTDKGDWDIRVAASLDDGATFQPSVKANDDATCATHFHHQIATDAAGNVHLVYYDNRYLKGNVFYQRSPGATDAAPLSFGAAQFVNSQSFPFTTDRASNDWLGDYLGLWVSGGSIYATWTDPRGGDVSHVYFAHGTIK